MAAHILNNSSVYKTNLISTIVDILSNSILGVNVYKTNLISTIVDYRSTNEYDNLVYKTNLISTIVDGVHLFQRHLLSIRLI